MNDGCVLPICHLFFEGADVRRDSQQRLECCVVDRPDTNLCCLLSDETPNADEIALHFGIDGPTASGEREGAKIAQHAVGHLSDGHQLCQTRRCQRNVPWSASR